MKRLYKIRRVLLRYLVPPFLWPKVVIIDNASINLRDAPYSFGIKLILVRNNYEFSERMLIKRVLRKGSRVIELGGSIGIIAAVSKEIIGDAGLFVYVEASREVSDYSRTWLESKDGLFVECGLGFPVYRVPEIYTKFGYEFDGNTLGGRVNFLNDTVSDSQLEIFDLKKIEEKYNLKAEILIVDIEGSEIVLIEDEMIVPDYIEHIIIEMHPNIYGFEIEQMILRRLGSLGFDLVEEIKHVYLLSRL